MIRIQRALAATTMNDGSLTETTGTEVSTWAAPPQVVAWLVDLAPGWADLAAEWLAAAGYSVRHWTGCEAAPSPPARHAPAVVLLGLAFPRRDGAQQVQAARQRWPGAALLLLSPTFHAGVACDGSLAHALGADGIVPLPAGRDALLAAVRRVRGAAA